MICVMHAPLESTLVITRVSAALLESTLQLEVISPLSAITHTHINPKDGRQSDEYAYLTVPREPHTQACMCTDVRVTVGCAHGYLVCLHAWHVCVSPAPSVCVRVRAQRAGTYTHTRTRTRTHTYTQTHNHAPPHHTRARTSRM